jgi:hypothetical protein
MGTMLQWNRVNLEKLIVSQLSQEFSHLLCPSKSHYRFYNILPLQLVLGQLNPVCKLASYFLKISLNTRVISHLQSNLLRGLLPSGFPTTLFFLPSSSHPCLGLLLWTIHLFHFLHVIVLVEFYFKGTPLNLSF